MYMLTLKTVNILTQLLNPFVFHSVAFFAFTISPFHYGLVHSQALESKRAILQTIKLRTNMFFVKPHAFLRFSFCFQN